MKIHGFPGGQNKTPVSVISMKSKEVNRTVILVSASFIFYSTVN